MIVLSDGTVTLNLNPDLWWSDEFAWNPVAQSAERGLTGSLILQRGQMVKGRPITLEPNDDGSAWTTRAQVESLRNWAAEAGKVMALTLHGVTRNVVFRHQDGGFEARPVLHYRQYLQTDFYLITLRLMEIE